MSSSDYNVKLVRDSRLNDITSQLEVACPQGGNQCTYQQYSSISSSTSSLSWNVQPPSENIVIDRNVLISSRVNFQIAIGPNVGVGTDVFSYPDNACFQAFPLNNLFTTSSCTINNTSVSVNTIDVMAPLLNLMDEEELGKYKGMSPYMIDRYQSHVDASVSTNGPFNDYRNGSFNQHLMPRGAHPLDSVVVNHYTNGVLIPGGSTVSTGTTDSWIIEVSATFCEPLFLSPYLFHSRYNEAGFLGINALNFVFNVDSQCRRFWSTSLISDDGNGNIPYNVSLDVNNPFSDPKLLFTFLTSQPTDLLDARNVLPYVDYPRFSTSQQNTNTMPPGGNSTVISNNIQLNQIPDKFIVVVRKRLSDSGPRDPNAYMRINSISINFNNSSGLLSSATINDLWRISVNNGSKQSFLEFSGRANAVQGGNSSGTLMATSGSVLVLDPSRDMSLPSYITSGSIGNYQFQMNLNVDNISNDTYAPEILVIVANSGIFTTIAGASSITTALLNKEIVMNTSTSQGKSALSSNEYNRMRGGALSDQISSALKHVPMVKKYLSNKSGGASSGGASSGGASSGGARSGGMPYGNKLDGLLM